MSPQHPQEYGRDGAAEEAAWNAARSKAERQAFKDSASKDARALASDLEAHADTFADRAGDVVSHADAAPDLGAVADLMLAADMLAGVQRMLDDLPDEFDADTLPDFVDDLARLVYANGRKEGGAK